jgi:hypothetical protein
MGGLGRLATDGVLSRSYLTKPLDRAQLSETIDQHLASAASSFNAAESPTLSAFPNVGVE